MYCKRMRLEQSKTACRKMRSARLECINCDIIPGRDVSWETGLKWRAQLFYKKNISGKNKKERKDMEEIKTESQPQGIPNPYQAAIKKLDSQELISKPDNNNSKKSLPCIKCGVATTNPGLICYPCLCRNMLERKRAKCEDRADGLKVCKICGQEKPNSEYWTKQTACKPCYAARSKERRARRQKQTEMSQAPAAKTPESAGPIIASIRVAGLSLNLARYPEIQKWLEELAAQEIRTLEEQAIYCLRTMQCAAAQGK